jgi:hypothetical protein
LTRTAYTPHDVQVQRVVSFILAVVVTLWLPVHHPGGPDREASHPTTAGSAQTERPYQAADLAPRMVAGTASTWQARLAHDALAPGIWSAGRLDYPLSASVSTARVQLHIAAPLRTFPLLI